MPTADAQSTTTDARPYDVRFPQRDAREVAQDEEWCEVTLDGERQRVRFHDYNEIYEQPGLYEQLFYTELQCVSPETVCQLLGAQLGSRGLTDEDLRVLDVGAGNGMVGEELRRIGASHVVGADIIPEAASAAERDRPGVYDDYLVADLTDLSPDEDRELADAGFNCLTTVAALGFGDIPPEAFAVAYNHVEPGGLIAFNIKEDFLRDGDGSGFSRMVKRAIDDGALELIAEQAYRHRLSVTGEPLRYVALVGVKRADLPVS